MGTPGAMTPHAGTPALYHVDCLEQMVEQEVRSWYRTFYYWSRGLCPRENESVMPIFNALADEFRVLLTNGKLMNKSEYWERLLSLHGVRRGDPPSQIVNLDMQRIERDHVLVVFDLYKRGVLKKKFDSAVMRRAADKAGGVAWVYVHESDHALESEPTIRRGHDGELVTG